MNSREKLVRGQLSIPRQVINDSMDPAGVVAYRLHQLVDAWADEVRKQQAMKLITLPSITWLPPTNAVVRAALHLDVEVVQVSSVIEIPGDDE